jgi:nucleotidyltransferase substrate binding protein (TIGR01987 family)
MGASCYQFEFVERLAAWQVFNPMPAFNAIHCGPMEEVQITQLEKAHGSLRRSIAVFDRVSIGNDADLIETTRAGVVQNFEVAYEQSWKVLRRWLMQYFAMEDTEISQRRQLYRLAAKHLLIDDVNAWWDFHAARNLTSHTYNPKIAIEVAVMARQFDIACGELIARLKLQGQHD